MLKHAHRNSETRRRDRRASRTRGNGSVTWQKQPKHGAFFASHDLTHFAVETVLGYRGGFFGLIAEGWELQGALGAGPRGPVSDEANEVEKIVGLFDSERASRVLWSREEFNSFSPRPLIDEEIGRVRAIRARLFKKWAAVRTGEALQLEFVEDHGKSVEGRKVPSTPVG